MLYIHPDECIDCGACEPVCPVKAIFAEDETPEQWKNYIELNKQFFKDNPGVKPTTKKQLHRPHGTPPRPLCIRPNAAGFFFGRPPSRPWHRRRLCQSSLAQCPCP